jgi:hypothetical protein
MEVDANLPTRNGGGVGVEVRNERKVVSSAKRTEAYGQIR